MNIENMVIRNKKVLLQIIEDLNIKFTLDYMLDNFKSIINSKNVNKSKNPRFRIIAVEQINDNKTKRTQVYSISVSTLPTDDALKQEIFGKMNIFCSLFKQLKLISDIENEENNIKESNQMILIFGGKHIKGLPYSN
jgi:vacuolar-type H+-ATPase catalytic subunit A/Vma1